ncbi:MAG: dihydroorotate dehydrogenase-like protein [Deltaproteobacteria bacterium]|nr:dihydroorotate dehydrogenase-like protein [Deltaproteobacteria bacterium]
MSAPDLRTDYLGLELRCPLVASSSPLTGNLDGLRRLEDAGAGAVVLPSLFEEQLEAESLEVHGWLETGAESHAEASGYFPELHDYDLGSDSYCELIRRAKECLEIPVIASLNGTTPGGWVGHAREFEKAGADALELNLYGVAADPTLDAASVEARDRALVKSVREAVDVPLAVKLSPFFTAFAHMARELVASGADGLVLFNRFYQPDLDLESLAVTPHLVLSSRDELRLPLRWIGILHGRISASLAATTGIHEAEDALKVLLAGADVAMLASALLERGPEHLAHVCGGLLEWLEAHEYESVRQLCGSVSQGAAGDPEAFERANYVETLRSWPGHTARLGR